VSNLSRCFLLSTLEVHPFIRKREWLNQCQVEIGHEEHAFLKHHSFINCSEAHNFALRDVYEAVEKDIGRLKGEVAPQIREQIIAAVKFATTITLKHKTAILSALDSGHV
jgi:hypothetical protein